MTERAKILAVMPGGLNGLEETGVIGEVVKDRGGILDWVYRVRGDTLPEVSRGFDGLIVFGGEIGAHQAQYAGYFNDLYRLIRSFHGEEKPVFGSCLGAQSIACAFGGEAMPQGFLEFGFTELRVEPEARVDPLLSHVAGTVSLFEMHNDTFNLPREAVLLLRGDRIVNQAYRIGSATYGFQCHFEATPNMAHLWKKRELAADPRYSEAQLAEMSARLDQEFARFGAAQRTFGLTVMNRWMDLFR